MQGRTNETCWIRNTQVKLAKFGNNAERAEGGMATGRVGSGADFAYPTPIPISAPPSIPVGFLKPEPIPEPNKESGIRGDPCRYQLSILVILNSGQIWGRVQVGYQNPHTRLAS